MATRKFYASQAWRSARYGALKRSKGKCQCCGSTHRLQVDHVKPRSKLEIPPADDGVINGTIMDVWQTPLEDVGPAGVDKGKGGKCLTCRRVTKFLRGAAARCRFGSS